jgi:hypothetical protein
MAVPEKAFISRGLYRNRNLGDLSADEIDNHENMEVWG